LNHLKHQPDFRRSTLDGVAAVISRSEDVTVYCILRYKDKSFSNKFQALSPLFSAFWDGKHAAL